MKTTPEVERWFGEKNPPAKAQARAAELTKIVAAWFASPF